jgi:uncharacterized protein
MIDRICIGTVQFGKEYGISNLYGKTSENEVFKILDFCANKGIQWLDTAEDYGDSQKVLGKYLKSNPGVFKLQSKVSNKSNSSSIKRNFHKTLEELNVEYLNSYLFHSYEKFKSESYLLADQIKEIKESGLCLSIGVSLYEDDHALDEKVLRFSDEIQLPFNLLDNYTNRGEVIKKLLDKRKKIQIRSIFLQGLLLMNFNKLPKELNDLNQSLFKIKNIAKRHNMSITELSLYYSFYNMFADKILLGVETLQQLKFNLSLIQKSLNQSEDIFFEINEVKVENKLLLNPSNWNV